MFPVGELLCKIEQYQGLRALRLEGNTVGVEADKAIAKALESKDQLQVRISFYFTVKRTNIRFHLNLPVASANSRTVNQG